MINEGFYHSNPKLKLSEISVVPDIPHNHLKK